MYVFNQVSCQDTLDARTLKQSTD